MTEFLPVDFYRLANAFGVSIEKVHEAVGKTGRLYRQLAVTPSRASDPEKRVIRAACAVVAADTYKHPILSREEAVTAGVAELQDAVNAYHSDQPAQEAPRGEQPPITSGDGTQSQDGLVPNQRHRHSGTRG